MNLSAPGLEMRRTTVPFLDGVGLVAPGSSVWEQDAFRRPILRLEQQRQSGVWQMVVYDDGTFVDRHHPNHPWSLGYMALEVLKREGGLGTIREWAERKLAQGWRFAIGVFDNEPRLGLEMRRDA